MYDNFYSQDAISVYGVAIIHAPPHLLESTGIFLMISYATAGSICLTELHPLTPPHPTAINAINPPTCATVCLPTLPAYCTCTIQVTNYFRFRLTRPITLIVLPCFTNNERSPPSRPKKPFTNSTNKFSHGCTIHTCPARAEGVFPASHY